MPKTSQVSDLILRKTYVFQQNHAFFCFFFTTFVAQMMIGYIWNRMKKIFLAIAVLFALAAHAQNNENMKEVQAYLKECGAFFIATADGDQPHVRPFGVSEIIDGRLYIMTGKVKDVYKQIAKNGKFEICALKPSGSEWMRLSGTLVNDETLAVKEEFLNRNEGLKSMYKADDDNMAVLQITNATARFCSFSAPERKVNF
jgi:uncharacterized pyridoxamine 5'-phosphate oxidase family protein